MTIPSGQSEVEALIRLLAPTHGLDPDIEIRQCEAESSFNQRAVSGCGARGLFQLMPATAKELKVDPDRWTENVAGGLKYMGRLLKRYGDTAKALAAYNWGMGHLDSCLKQHGDAWREHLPAETRNYLERILS